MTDLEAIFFDALEHEASESRAAYLDRACHGDVALVERRKGVIFRATAARH